MDAHTHPEGAALHPSYDADCHALPRHNLAGAPSAPAERAATVPAVGHRVEGASGGEERWR